MRVLRKIINWWAALTAAALLAPLGSAIGWQHAGELPTDDQLRSIVATAAPGFDIGAEFRRADYLSGSPHANPNQPWTGYDDYGAGYAEVRFPRPSGTDLTTMAARLNSAGWRVGEPSGGELTAAQRDWRLVVQEPTASSEPVVAWIERSQPRSALLLVLLFWLAGALLGAGIVRLTRGSGGGGWGVLGLALLSLHTVLVSVYLVVDVRETWGTGPFPLPWEPIMDGAVRPLSALGALTIVGWLAVLLAARRRTAHATDRTVGAVPSAEAVAPNG